MLSDGEYISDIEEGICKFLLWWNLTPALSFISYLWNVITLPWVTNLSYYFEIINLCSI
jgi:hypothetical protein